MLCIPDNIKLCYFNDDAVILNVIQDEFFVVENGACLMKTECRDAQILELLGNNFCITEVPSLRAEKDDGYFEVRWMKPLFTRKKVSPVAWIRFFFKMKSLVRLVDKGGVAAVKNAISALRENMSVISDKPGQQMMDEFNSLISSVMRFYRFENPCLIYSFIMTHMLLEHGYNARIAIGVRTEPFFSHAWVEINGEVYGDDRALRKKLSVIMEI